jgi:hypothetical protein
VIQSSARFDCVEGLGPGQGELGRNEQAFVEGVWFWLRSFRQFLAKILTVVTHNVRLLRVRYGH